MQSQSSNKQQNIFLSSELVFQSQIISQISNDNNFAVFGFNKDIQQIQQSTINVTITYITHISALICFQCDIQISSSELVFIAFGNILSGLMCTSGSIINITNSTLQYRFSSVCSAGLVINITQQLSFDLNNVKMLSYNNYSYYALFVYHVDNQQIISISNVQVCSTAFQNTVVGPRNAFLNQEEE
ncbi:Hypothetical_protein [Hexamita inflata]|uniref:Hypothetical_protein n=1 Tax=Hexamita inflata TaxID=28002 RepID=A0AA86NQA4_9EUKA|nr:Hypothetical protein HINF_LOCUS10973 [Hexamita inflata]